MSLSCMRFQLWGGRLLHLSPWKRPTDFNPHVHPRSPVPAPIGRVTVSNVTGSGFHVAWAADPALRPTFQLTLTAARGPAVRLHTRDAGLALGGLEPGVLHLLDIVAQACGKEGAGARVRVRTGKGLRRGPATCSRRGWGAGRFPGAVEGLEERDSPWRPFPGLETAGQTGGGSFQGKVSGDSGQGRAPAPDCPPPPAPRPRGSVAGRCSRCRPAVRPPHCPQTGSGFRKGRRRAGRPGDPWEPGASLRGRGTEPSKAQRTLRGRG